MKARVRLEAGAFERYVIARFYAARDGERPRATREQVRRFAAQAMARAVRELAADLPARQRATAMRLRDGWSQAVLPLPRSGARQPDLF